MKYCIQCRGPMDSTRYAKGFRRCEACLKKKRKRTKGAKR